MVASNSWRLLGNCCYFLEGFGCCCLPSFPGGFIFGFFIGLGCLRG